MRVAGFAGVVCEAEAEAQTAPPLLHQDALSRAFADAPGIAADEASARAARFTRDCCARGAFCQIGDPETQRALSDARLRPIAFLNSHYRALALPERLAGVRAEEIIQ